MTDDADRPSLVPLTAKEKHEHLSKHLSDVLTSSKEELHPSVYAAANHPLVLKSIKKLKKAKGDDNLSSIDLKALNKRFMSGYLPRSKPSVEAADDTDDEDEEDETPVYNTEKSYIVTKILTYQLRTAAAVRNYILNYVSKYGNTWLRSIIPTRQITTLITFLVYTYIFNAEFLLNFLPPLLFAISFVVMLVSTLQSLRGEKRFKEFVAWSELLVSVDSALNIHEAEDNYFRNHISPLLSLVPAVILNVVSFSLTSSDILPSSELALLSLGLGVASFYSFFNMYDKTSFYALGCQLIASMLEGFQRLSDDVNRQSKWIVQLASFNSFEFNLTPSVLLRFIAVALVVTIPFQSRHRSTRVGIIRGFFPILYVLLWWELFCFFLLDSSVFGMVRAGVGVTVLLFSIPATILLFFFALLKWLISLHLLRVALVSLVFLVPLTYFRYWHNHESLKSQYLRVKRCIGPGLKILSLVVFVGVLVVMVCFYRPAGLQIHNSALTWKDYRDSCFDSNRDSVMSKRFCHQLNGHHVSWTGVIKDIQITSIENTFESVLHFLPSSLANWLSCVYGKAYRQNDEDCQKSEHNSHLCFIGEKSCRECNLDRYNKYEFVIVVEHADEYKPPLLVRAMTSNRFKKLVFLLRKGTKIKYKGVLEANAVEVNVDKIIVLETNFKRLPRKDVGMDFSLALDEAARALMRFFFSPFLTFAESEE